MKKILLYILPLLLVVSACSKDDKGAGGNPTPNPEDVRLAFMLNLPKQSKNQRAYALDEVDENHVQTVNVLAFRENTSTGRMELADWTEAIAGSIVNVGAGEAKKTFSIKFSRLTKNTIQYEFVIVANAKTEVENMFSTHSFTIGAPKETMLEKIHLEGVAGWINSSTTPGYRDIPMWGESVKMSVNDNDISIADIKMLRMLARVNVGLDPAVQPKFELTQIDLYNYSEDGRVVPNSNYVTNTPAFGVTAPSEVGAHILTPVQYMATSVTDMTNEVFTFESKVPYDAQSKAELDKIACLVIGGKYDGDAVASYYRLDFARKNPSAIDGYDYMDLLRNYSYQINITNVNGRGYNTSKEAFDSRLVDIDMEIEVFNDYSLDNIEVDDQHTLEVTHGELVIYSDGGSVSMEVKTSHPSGWLPENVPSWLTLNVTGGNGQNQKSLVEVKATPLVGAGREGKFAVVAGNMNKHITVKQLGDTDLRLEVSPTMLVFAKTPQSHKNITVKNNPVVLSRALSYDGNVEFESGNNPVVEKNNKTYPEYSVKPTINNTGTVLSGVMGFLVQLPSGERAMKSVMIRQLTSDDTFSVSGNEKYPADAGTRSFDVLSTLPWKLNTSSIGDPSGIVTSHPTTEQPAAPLTAATYSFNLSQNKTYAERSAIFYASSLTNPGDFPNTNVQINQKAYPLRLVVPDTAIDLGVATTTKNAALTSNAGWMVSSVSNSNVVESTVPVVGAVQTGSTSVLTDVAGNITLTPSAAYVGLGAAGTEISGTVTVSTATHSGATAISKTFNVKRTIQPYWEYVAISPASTTTPPAQVAHEGQNVTVYATTNAAWRVESNVAATVSAVASAYGVSKELPIAIPKNETWTAKTVTVSAIQEGGKIAVRGTYNQAPYTFGYHSGIPTSIIPAAGSTNNIVCKTTTSSPSVRIRAIVEGVDVVSNEVFVPAIASTSVTQYGKVIVKANGEAVHNGAAKRTVTYYWAHPDKWIKLGASTQYGYNLSYLSGAPTTNMSALAHTLDLTFKTTGNAPSGYFARATLNGAEISRVAIPVATTPNNTTAGLSITANDSWTATRSIVLQWGNETAWFTIGTYTQAAYGITVTKYANDSFYNGQGGSDFATLTSSGGSPAVSLHRRTRTGGITGQVGPWMGWYDAGIIPAIPAGGSINVTLSAGPEVSNMTHEFYYYVNAEYFRIGMLYVLTGNKP